MSEATLSRLAGREIAERLLLADAVEKLVVKGLLA